MATENDLLDEMKWLQEQNQFLHIELETLAEETLELNRELLDLELQRAAAEQLVEPAPEKKIVYDLVDVPLGTNIAFEPGENEKPDLTDTALSYDPDTGFYLNPQFDEASNVPTENDASGSAPEAPQPPEKIAFPPIQSSP